MQCSVSVGHEIWPPFLSPRGGIERKKKKTLRSEEEPATSTTVVRLRRLSPPLICPFRRRIRLPLPMPRSSLQIGRKCAPLPDGVANTAQRKDAREEEKAEGEFPFLLPRCARLFIYFAFLGVHLESPPRRVLGCRVGWRTSHPTSLKGESTRGRWCAEPRTTMRQRM